MVQDPTRRPYDVAIVGGGPAGLAAAMYLGRFQRSVIVFDSGDARAKLIPRTPNCPGFPGGIGGEELLRRLRMQAIEAGSEIREAEVAHVARLDNTFLLEFSRGSVEARYVILASGIVDRAPALTGLRDAIEHGIVRLCPVCDAYEASGKRIGVVGPEGLALAEALFLRDYSPHVSMLFNHAEDVSAQTRRQAGEAGIGICQAVDEIVPCGGGLEIVSAQDLPPTRIDVLYAAMGCDVRSELALMLGADCDEVGYMLVGEHMRSSIAGLYAIGDVARALNQIAVGFGHAATAAADIHRQLRTEHHRVHE